MDLFIKFLVAAIGAGTPLLFGTVGEILNEKVGHLNLGVEGMMAIGACAGFMGGYLSDNFLVALLCAFVAGMLAALIYAVLTVTFMANQNVAGLTMTIFGVGISNFIGVYMIGTSEGGTLKLPENVTAQMRSIHIPVLSDLPVVGELLFSYNPFVYLGIVVAAVCGWYLYRTKTGLNVQAIGENPGAADAASIQVTRWKYFNILLGGGICGIGGAYCGMIINGGVWISNSVNGLGWIAVALVIFAAWKPHMAIRCAARAEILQGGLHGEHARRLLRHAALPDHRAGADHHQHAGQQGCAHPRVPGQQLLPRGAVSDCLPA